MAVKIKTLDLKPGMEIARDVKDLHGRLIAPAGAKTSAKHLKVFKIWGVSEVFIKGDSNTEKKADPTVNEEEKKSLKILLTEDCWDNQLLIQLYLKKTGHELDIAENGEFAVKKFISGNYDLILMDIQMPVMDGYTATRKIREWEKEKNLKEVPILALTAHALKGGKERCAHAGCSDYIAKPIKKEKLLNILDDYAEKRGKNN